MLKERISKIKVLVCDVDGVLTDGSMYYSANGEELKRFNVKDGMGIVLLRKSGIKSAILTSESSPIVSSRAKKLQIDKVILGSRNKTEDLKEIAKHFEIELNEIAYIGDDINDYHCMKLVGFAACPFDAMDQIKEIVHYTSTKEGGRGAVREIAEMILKEQNKSIFLNENW